MRGRVGARAVVLHKVDLGLLKLGRQLLKVALGLTTTKHHMHSSVRVSTSGWGATFAQTHLDQLLRRRGQLPVHVRLATRRHVRLEVAHVHKLRGPDEYGGKTQERYTLQASGLVNHDGTYHIVALANGALELLRQVRLVRRR